MITGNMSFEMAISVFHHNDYNLLTNQRNEFHFAFFFSSSKQLSTSKLKCFNHQLNIFFYSRKVPNLGTFISESKENFLEVRNEHVFASSRRKLFILNAEIDFKGNLDCKFVPFSVSYKSFLWL